MPDLVLSLLCGLLVSLPAWAGLPADDAGELASAIQRHYDQVRDFRADFTHSYTGDGPKVGVLGSPDEAGSATPQLGDRVGRSELHVAVDGIAEGGRERGRAIVRVVRTARCPDRVRPDC